MYSIKSNAFKWNEIHSRIYGSVEIHPNHNNEFMTSAKVLVFSIQSNFILWFIAFCNLLCKNLYLLRKEKEIKNPLVEFYWSFALFLDR